MSTTRLFPTSPLKPNVLQPSFKGNSSGDSVVSTTSSNSNISSISAEMLNILKPLPDSTGGGGNENSKTSPFVRGSALGRGSKRKRGEKDPMSAAAPPSSNLNLSVPFVKHHHSVKKFQENLTECHSPDDNANVLDWNLKNFYILKY
jgi:hypothetical protein